MMDEMNQAFDKRVRFLGSFFLSLDKRGKGELYRRLIRFACLITTFSSLASVLVSREE